MNRIKVGIWSIDFKTDRGRGPRKKKEKNNSENYFRANDHEYNQLLISSSGLLSIEIHQITPKAMY